MSVYLAEGINPKAVSAFIKNCAENNINLRMLQVVKGGVPLVRFALEPYSTDSACYLYSLSKSFTSIACGMCIEDGLLSTETKMADLFPDKMPEVIDENLASLTLGDLLSMQSGHGSCALSQMRTAEDSLKTFFAQPFVHKPGTVFVYDSGATCVCAAAAERVTGKKLVDFLDERLFSKLDIEKPRWDECVDGQTFGGTGLYLSGDSIVKFGTMLKNKGVYNGQRIIGEEYINRATSKQSSTADNGASDWAAGYGYQFWLNGKDGFRGDGAFGQFCYVFPKSDTVVALTGESGYTVKEVELLYELLDNMLSGDTEGYEELEELIKTVYRPTPVEGGFNKDLSFAVAENPADVRKIRFFGEKLLHVEFQTDYGKKEIVCGNGEYISNHVLLKNLCVGLDARDERKDTIERVNLFAAYETDGEDSLKLTLRHMDKPHNQHWYVDLSKGTIEIKIMVGTIQTTEFKLTPIENTEN
ncbi:MAG: beta-lactamase family protein [Ruminococcaceae bacterium]|nr:beta-lactamase family protein [Oscillospiraceae bacterium]